MKLKQHSVQLEVIINFVKLLHNLKKQYIIDLILIQGHLEQAHVQATMERI